MANKACDFRKTFDEKIIDPECHMVYLGRISLLDITPPTVIASVVLAGKRSCTERYPKKIEKRQPGVLSGFLDDFFPKVEQYGYREVEDTFGGKIESNIRRGHSSYGGIDELDLYCKVDAAIVAKDDKPEDGFKMELINSSLRKCKPVSMKTLDSLFDPSIEKILKQMEENPLF